MDGELRQECIETVEQLVEVMASHSLPDRYPDVHDAYERADRLLAELKR
jgi:hypothetical protein